MSKFPQGRMTCEEKRAAEARMINQRIRQLILQMAIVLSDEITMKQQIAAMKQQIAALVEQVAALVEKKSCQHEGIARNKDACRTPPRPTNTGRAPRTRSPQTPLTPPTIPPRSTPAALSTLPSLSPLSSVELTELLEMLGPNIDIDLEIERNRHKQ